MHTLDHIRRRLWNAGWSAGETGGITVWLVVVKKGKHTIHASGPTQTAAWQSALDLTGLRGLPFDKGNHAE